MNTSYADEIVRLREENRRLNEALDELRKDNLRLRDALDEVRDLIDGYVDVVDGDYGQPAPNKAMKAVQIIEAARVAAHVEGHAKLERENLTPADMDKWLLKLILRISTDCAQTALEDPIKYGDGWVLHSQPVLQDIAEAAKMANKALREARAAIQGGTREEQ